MRPNRLILAAAIAYAIPGLALTFGPDEVLAWAGAAATPLGPWLAQLLGAALLGLALLNWMQRHALVGGIYGRPLLFANLVFLMVAFFASLRTWRAQGGSLVLVVTGVLGILLFAFGRRFFRAPDPVKAAAREEGPSA